MVCDRSGGKVMIQEIYTSYNTSTLLLILVLILIMDFQVDQ